MKAQHEFVSKETYQEYLRTYFAIMAMQGILSNYFEKSATFESIANDSVTQADALINALNKEQ